MDPNVGMQKFTKNQFDQGLSNGSRCTSMSRKICLTSKVYYDHSKKWQTKAIELRLSRILANSSLMKMFSFMQ